jgi:hypothetical protein
MKVYENVLVQVFAICLQILNFVLPNTSGEVRFAVLMGIGITQLITSIYAHYHNPDGGKAQLPWVRPWVR